MLVYIPSRKVKIYVPNDGECVSMQKLKEALRGLSRKKYKWKFQGVKKPALQELETFIVGQTRIVYIYMEDLIIATFVLYRESGNYFEVMNPIIPKNFPE